MTKPPRQKLFRGIPCLVAMGMTALTTLSLSLSALPASPQNTINAAEWGAVTAPIFNTSQSGLYAGAELFAGPNQFGSYYAGVLPNGRKVTPAGISAQIGMNPLGMALTPDGKFLVTSNDDERELGLPSLQDPANQGGYSLSVLDTASMKVLSQINRLDLSNPQNLIPLDRMFVGIQIKEAFGGGGYSAYVSAAPDAVRIFHITPTGKISYSASIAIHPKLPRDKGYVSNYTVAPGSQAAFPAGSATIYRPAGYSPKGAQITFPAGSALSPDGRYLYVTCNGDNSLAIIDTISNQVLPNRILVGYFPYGVSVSRDGSKVYVANWGVTEYKFGNATYNANGDLTAINPVTTLGPNLPDGFYVPPTSIKGKNPQTSSVSIIAVPHGDPNQATLLGAIYEGQPHGIDAEKIVGETHPSASAIVYRGEQEILYVCKANSDSIGLIAIHTNKKLPDFDLSPIHIALPDRHKVHGAYPNAIAVSPDNTRAYVAEAGINSVAVLDTSDPVAPKLLGRIPTGWYPTGVVISADGKTLYVINAKGIGEDINPNTNNGNAANDNRNATGVESFMDGNFIFGSAQKIDLTQLILDNITMPANNFAIRSGSDASVVPLGGAPSKKIKHVFFILGENKTFDTFFGDLGGDPQTTHFGPYASTTFNNATGATVTNYQFTQVVPNLRLLAQTFATGVNYYSDSEESDAGHQFSASGTASDYTEKTLLNKAARGMLVNKNFDAEDYPEGGYIFNNAARHRVNFKLYGLEAARIIGSDTGDSSPASVNDPTTGGKAGYPLVDIPATFDSATPATSAMLHTPFTNPSTPAGDVSSPTSPGVGQSFFMKYPGLAVLGAKNPNGSARLDLNYPGYNFNISDQRRAREFCADFDRMLKAGQLPEFLYIYVPNMHTGGVRATNVGAVNGSVPPAQQVADGDVAIGMVVQHIMSSPVYHDAKADTGSAIFITVDDAQSNLDHIHEHRTPLIVVSPFARPGYLAKRHYSTASIVKTEELLLGLPPNNLGDLFATDLRDMFQPTDNGIKVADSQFTSILTYAPSPEGMKIWALVKHLDTSAPDRDSHRLGALTRLSMQADDLHKAAVRKGHLQARQYKLAQARLYQIACNLIKMPDPRDTDD